VLAAGHAQALACEVGERRDGGRVPGRQDEALLAPCPGNQDEVGEVEAAGGGEVEAPSVRVGQVDAGHHGLAGGEPPQAVAAALSEEGQARARAAGGPFEQRVVTAGKHGGEGRVRSFTLGQAQEPGIEEAAWE
jgi:hypothetical protein